LVIFTITKGNFGVGSNVNNQFKVRVLLMKGFYIVVIACNINANSKEISGSGGRICEEGVGEI